VHAYVPLKRLQEDENLFYLEDTASRYLILPHAPNSQPLARAAAARLTTSTNPQHKPVQLWEIDWHHTAHSIRLQPSKSSASAAPSSPSATSPLPSAQPSDVALILHTSGTTSRPKAVPLSHRNLCESAHTIANGTYALRPADRTLLVMPLFHVHGLVGALLATLWSGGSCVVPSKFSARTFWSEFENGECTWYTAVPTIHQILLAHEKFTPPPLPAGDKKQQKSASALPEAAALCSAPVRAGGMRVRKGLRFIRSCSSALAPATHTALEACFGVPVLEAYAMTGLLCSALLFLSLCVHYIE
jgi:acyl-CoA synthetase (AMP-forming)/AMP-acid ligase II